MRTPGRDPLLQTPLLDPFEADAQQPFVVDDERKWVTSHKCMLKDFGRQLSLAGPLAVNLLSANVLALINLYFVARGGTVQLAAAALGNNVAVMVGRLVLLGLCGALDTLAAQAWGAGKERRLPLLLQRTVLFLWLHCIAISATMLLLPECLRALGQDPVLSGMVVRYLAALLPAVWLEAVSRPLTRVLVARGSATPVMVVSLVALPLNVATNYCLVVVAGWEYLGAAVAVSAAAGYDVIMLLLYVAISGQWANVVGTPSRKALKGWRQLARMAYPAASMKCAESWAFTICTLAASLLPDPCTATAAVGVSYNVYGTLFIAFVACCTAACVTVGNRLGAGDPRGARLAAAGSLLIVPPAWVLAAVALLVPRCQRAIMGLFGAAAGGDGGGDGGDGGGDPAALAEVLPHMFVIVAGLVLLDGIQTVLSGVIQGCGRQRAGALVNLVAFYVFAVPLALLLAFRLPLPPRLGGGVLGLGLGPEGLYLGMIAGPAIQTVCYSVILLRTDWEAASRNAMRAASLASSCSLGSLVRRLESGGGGGGCFWMPEGVPVVYSAASSASGMAGSFVGEAAWRLPAIEEHCREGRDSSDSFGVLKVAARGFGSAVNIGGDSRAEMVDSVTGSSGIAAAAAAGAAAAMDTRLQYNIRLLTSAFGGGGGGRAEGSGEEEEGEERGLRPEGDAVVLSGWEHGTDAAGDTVPLRVSSSPSLSSAPSLPSSLPSSSVAATTTAAAAAAADTCRSPTQQSCRRSWRINDAGDGAGGYLMSWRRAAGSATADTAALAAAGYATGSVSPPPPLLPPPCADGSSGVTALVVSHGWARKTSNIGIQHGPLATAPRQSDGGLAVAATSTGPSAMPLQLPPLLLTSGHPCCHCSPSSLPGAMLTHAQVHTDTKDLPALAGGIADPAKAAVGGGGGGVAVEVSARGAGCPITRIAISPLPSSQQQPPLTMTTATIPTNTDLKKTSWAEASTAAGEAEAVASSRWFRFGLFRAEGHPVAQGAGAAAAGPKVLAAETVAAAVTANSLPLQLPGVGVLEGPMDVLRDCEDEGGGGSVESAGLGPGLLGPGPAVVSSLPIAASAHSTWPSRIASDGVDGRGEGAGGAKASSTDSPSNETPASGYISGGSGGGLRDLAAAAQGAAVYRSCDSLAAAVLGSDDYYAFSASDEVSGGVGSSSSGSGSFEPLSNLVALEEPGMP